MNRIAFTRNGFTLVEVAIGAGLLSVLVAVLIGGHSLLNRKSASNLEALSRSQKAIYILENIRLELGSMILNYRDDARQHENDTFQISKPGNQCIRFVTEKREGSTSYNYLVQYELVGDSTDEESYPSLRKRRWRTSTDISNGWPSSWTGALVEDTTISGADLGLRDMIWEYWVQPDVDTRVFFRVKLLLDGDRRGKRLLPFTTLISIPRPPPPDASSCPCLFQPGFDPDTTPCP